MSPSWLKKFELSLKNYSLVVIKLIKQIKMKLSLMRNYVFGYNLKYKMHSFNTYYYKFNICFRFFFFFFNKVY